MFSAWPAVRLLQLRVGLKLTKEATRRLNSAAMDAHVWVLATVYVHDCAPVTQAAVSIESLGNIEDGSDLPRRCR